VSRVWALVALFAVFSAQASAPRAPNATALHVVVDGKGSAHVTGNAGAVADAATVIVRSFYDGHDASTAARADGSFTTQIAVKAFDALYIHAVSANGAEGPSTIVSAGSEPELSILGPGGEQKPGTVRLWGEIKGPLFTSVTIAGQLGSVAPKSGYTQTFQGIARIVPGRNTVDIVAYLPDGRTVTRHHAITASADPAVALDLDPSTGPAPLAVEIAVVTDPALQYDSIEYDRGNDGIIDRRAQRGTLIEDEFAGAFEYPVTVHLMRDGNRVRSAEHLVIVESTVGAQFTAGNVLHGFLAALANRQFDLAQARMTASARARYAPTFAEIGARMNAIVGQFSQPTVTRAGASIVEFAIGREVDGTQRAFLAYVLKEKDGQWRVQSL